MVMIDKRESFIVSTAGYFFGIPLDDEENSKLSLSVLDKFFNQSTCRTLCAQPIKSKNDEEVTLKLSNELLLGKNTLVFFKLAAKIVTEDNFHDLVQVTSIGGGESSTLVEVLRQVWAPTLKSFGFDPSSLKKLEEDLLGPRLPTSITEEENFWIKCSNDATRSRDKTTFNEAVQILNNIKKEFDNAAVSRDGFIGLEESLEAISGYVDDVWKLGSMVYKEERMKSLLEIIGNETVMLVENLINETNHGHSNSDTTVSMGAMVCEKWVNSSERLTGLFWPHYSLHPWKDAIFVPGKCSKLGKRLKQLSELRAQHRQLMRLLTSNERTRLDADNLLQNFQDIKIIYTDDDENDIEWNRTRRKIEEALIPTEELVAQKLKSQIADAKTPNSLLEEFRRYFKLIKRDALKKALRSEREALLLSYDDLIENCLAGPDTNDLLDTPKILQEIQTARYSEMRLESLIKLGKELLSDIPGFDETVIKVTTALKDAERKRQYLVESWVNDTKDAVAKKQLTLGSDSAVVELTGTSLMRVNYDPRLMTLIREARALSGQGVELPREIRDLVDRASLLAGRARGLQQVATFHNTIGDRMVPSQRPLMLTTALELARAVKEQSGVVWSDPKAVDGYTNRLRELVTKFARQNAELAAKHSTLRNLVSNLFKGEAINLVGNQNIWKDTLMNMRTIVDAVESEYGNTTAWKLHWDRQLLKALSVAYRGALPSLLRKLPDIKVELIFREGILQWRPTLEEIRAKIYSGIRRSLSIPMNFRGVGDVEHAQFGNLVQKSAYLFGGVYKQAEIALNALESVRIKWLNLAAPAKIDIGQKLKGASPNDWTKAFKDAKQWAQEVGKLRGGEVKVWCISIDTGTTRNDLESASRRYWERLCSDLRVEASSRLVAVVDFLSSAAKELEKRPHNVEEVGLANEAHERIQQQYVGVGNEMESVIGLAKVLAAWTSEKLEGINSANLAWQELSDRLEKHKTVVARQLEDTKVNLRHRGVALRDEIERWETKWLSKDDIITMDWISSMRDKWITLTEQRDSLNIDCQRIGLNLIEIIDDDDTTNLKKLEAQLEAEESNCRFQAEFIEELDNQRAEEWAVARRRLPRLHDWLDSWDTRIRLQSNNKDSNDQEQQSNDVVVETFVGKQLREIRDAIEWIQLLRGDEIADEHWTELKLVLDLNDIKNLRDLTLGHILDSKDKIKDNASRVKEITKRAAAESGIRQAILELESWETSASLQIQQSKDSQNSIIYLVGEYSNLLARTGELRLLLEGAKGAAGYERFAARATRCEASLSEIEERIKILSIVQRKWVYLEPIYGSGAAPNDSGKWSRTDKEFRYLMGEVSRDSRVSSIRRLPLPALINLKDLLDRCQRSLDEFLEERRSSFPRLYFLSDEDLLELVSGSGKALESHLPKLYQGIGSVIRNDNNLTAVVSPEGETLKLLETIDTSEPLPRWLNNLEKGMRNTLRQSLDKCLTDSSPDPSIYPNQILLLSERIRFTERCEAALKEGTSGLKKLVEFLDTQRARYRGLEDVGDKLTVLKARGLLLDTVHHLEISRTLLNTLEMGESTSWLWYRQLKTYRTTKGPIIRCAAAEFPYRFEYQGAAVGLVWTSLTEKCFLALTQAMKLGLGGSPTGPAGTGKTESVKALGGILGRLVIVFNCDEGMDAGSMKRILGGLAQAGAWGCFDEFNRLEEETLSAVAMLVRPLQEAVRDGLNQVVLGDQRVNLDPYCCVFITMNPAGNEYGGRHKLPDSLARLFRPIGMAHPDKFDIIRALLECAGFLESSVLANRLVETFDISLNLLSKQPHYDWGLRALRSVLDAISPVNQLDESTRLLIAIKDSTLPKLTEEDAKKFIDLLDDVFPNIDHSLTEIVSNEKKDLRDTLIELSEFGNYTSKIVDQCLQLNDQLKSRTGVAIVGPPGSGKTIIRKLLADALSKIGEPVEQYVIYPGAIPKSKLLGRIDPRTREWKEGLLSSAVITAGGNNSIWIILNGDVEPEWAEALNSALDDNRLLTLPNGVGVKLGNGIRFIFETHKLASASPATVSRLGVVHLGTISPTSLLQALIPDDLPVNIRDNIKTHLSTCIEEIFKSNSIRSSACGLINSVLHHLRDAHTQTLYTEALIGGLCCQIEDQNVRDNLGRLIYQLTDCWCPDPEKPLDVIYNDKSDRLEPLIDIYQSIETDDGPVLLSGPVKRALASILPWIEKDYPVILRGYEGSGKSTLITAALSSLKNHYNAPSMTLIQGSSLYGARDLLNRLKRACVRLDSSSHGRSYKPRNGSRVILILKDIHLASKQMQELVRELLQDKGFHEDDLEFARIPLTIICTADYNTPLHPRLECLMATYYLPRPSSKEIVAMLELHLRSALKQKDDFIDSWITKTASIMLDAYQSINISNELSFLWTPKDLILWADCLGYYLPSENDNDLTCHLLDAGKRLFYPKLTGKARVNWDSILSAQIVNFKNTLNDVFVWKTGDNELLPIVEEEWKNNIVNVAARCAREGEPIQATITSHLLQMVAGICWTLGTSIRGVILTGRPGAGRKSASKLAATFSSFRLIDSGPGRGKGSIKSAIQTAGIDGEPTILLLEEHHMREEGMSILVRAIVANGELPELFSIDELDGMIAPLMDLSRREDFSGTLEQYFYHRIRNYLRVIIILDIGDLKSEFLSRSGLLRICAIIGPSLGNEWWSYESPLTELAIQYYSHESDVPIESSMMGIEVMIKAHLQAPKEQQAPARFLALLYTSKKLREIWNAEVESKLNSLTAGINRLKEAGEHVAKLEDEVSKQRQELEIEKGRANAALEKITATMRGATGQRGEMTNLKAETERESAELARRKADIEGELSKVEPLVEQAAQAVAGISADALAEVRSLRAPPAPVRDVLEGVLRLMGIKDTSWNSMKTFLAKRGIKDEIRTWDARRSTSASLEAVAKLVKERPDSFEEKTARRASMAAAPLAAWVLANLQYGQIVQQVAPLEREQRLLAERLSAAEAQLGRLAAGLNTVESRVAQLQEELAEHSRGAAALQLRTESTESSLTTARSLLLKLDKEHRDWQMQLEELSNRKERLDIEAANVASFLVYQDPKRDDKWKRSAIELLINERERLIWRAQGLPADTGSLVGAACALRGPLVPIFLDPSGVAISWLKSNLGSKLEIIKADDKKFYTSLELAVRFGKALLVEEIVEFPSVLLPLLRKRALRLCDRILPAQQGFQLFLATRKDRLDNIPKEADAVLFQIALGAGTRSLAERLVDKVLLKETPEIESRRREALEREEKLSGERDAARVDLLAQLGRARGQDLLQETQGGQENDSNGAGNSGSGGGGLLTSLEKTQTKAKEILLALEESRRSLEDISKRIESRERLAKFAANVYKAVKGLTSLNPLYVFSTEAFTDIYLEAESTRSIAISDERREQDRLVEKRLIALTVQYCTKAAYRKHRLTLALYLALTLNPISEIDRNLLLDSGLPSNEDNVDLEVPDWIPDERRTAVKVLASFMPQVAGRMKRDWLNDIGNVYTDNSLTHLQRILIIKALRPDYLHTALSKFAISQLGVRDLSPPTWTLQKISENEGSSPILLLLSPGADPSPELKSLSKGFTEVSLGQGQVAQAELALETACKNGSWVLLSNLQLALTWLPRLESLLRSPMCTTNKNSTTRIWLTTEECEGFYPGLAGLCLKLAYEPPEGVKRNFKRSFQQLQQLDESKRNENNSGMFLLSWLHSTIQERRKFVPQAWIRSYEWNEADLGAAYTLIVDKTMKNNQTQNWETGQGLLDVAVYGGRLQDDYDMRALCAIIREIWSKDVFEGRRTLGGVLNILDISDNDPLKIVERLEDEDSPREYFGLPANAHRAWERVAAEIALTLLKGMTIKISSNDSRVQKKSENTIENNLKELLDRRLTKFEASSNPVSNDIKKDTPLKRFFDDELEFTRDLLNRIRLDLELIRIVDAKTPKKWMNQWESGPNDANTFVHGLLTRYQILESYVTTSFPFRIDLSKLARPRAFLAALKQHTAREINHPLENLRLRVNWILDDRKSEQWKVSVIIAGLLISGALIKDGTLKDVDVDAAPIAATPICQIAYLPERYSFDKDSDKKPLNSYYVKKEDKDWISIPVYSDSKRSLFVCSFPIGCPRENRNIWLRRSVALYLKPI